MNGKSAAAVIGAAVIAAAGSAALTASGADAPAQTLHLAATPKGGAQLDLGRKGVTVGDQFFENGAVSGDAKGTYTLSGQLVSGNARHGREHAAMTLYLAGGTIEVSGGHGLGSRFSMPIAGGTGTYEGARGILAVAPLHGETEGLTVTFE